MPLQDRRILICEDDPAMVRIFQFLLRQQGLMNVVTTTRGDLVKGMIQKERPDLVLLDMMLPGKDGLTVLRELKASAETQGIPVMVISGKESQEQVNQAMTAGAVDYIVKPFEPMELGGRIRLFVESLDMQSTEQPEGSLIQPPETLYSEPLASEDGMPSAPVMEEHPADLPSPDPLPQETPPEELQ